MAYEDDIHKWVEDYYGKTLQASSDLKTNACCAVGAPPKRIASALSNVHEDVLNRFYGCGFPIPESVEGANIVDLGSGTGRDVYILAQLVGEGGFVHGVDMTSEQLDVAKATQDWHTQRFGYKKSNVAFHQSYIEDMSALPIDSGSVDVVVSNCVVNLSPRKDLVFAEVYRMLKEGGEFYFSDVFADRRLPEHIANDPILHSECLGGALYEGDFLSMVKKAGFLDPREIERAPITIQNSEIEQKVGAARFVSVTYRLFKLPELDDRCEDYGQVATYTGGAGPLFMLDSHHLFEAGRPERVCGNTADMLSRSRLKAHFTIAGTKEVHYGPFDCSATMASAQYGNVDVSSYSAAPSAPSSCGPGSCC